MIGILLHIFLLSIVVFSGPANRDGLSLRYPPGAILKVRRTLPVACSSALASVSELSWTRSVQVASVWPLRLR